MYATFVGAEDSLRAAGEEVDAWHHKKCSRTMHEFIQKNPELWKEDVGC
jgi:hypothetical protein